MFLFFIFFFNDTATTEIYTLSLHDALPILAHGKTAAQVGLRFLVQQDIAVIPRTSRIERLEENFALFDFELSDAEMAEIAALASHDGRIVDYAYSGSPKWD